MSLDEVDSVDSDTDAEIDGKVHDLDMQFSTDRSSPRQQLDTGTSVLLKEKRKLSMSEESIGSGSRIQGPVSTVSKR